MAAPTPTTLTISYGTSSTQNVAIPANSNYSDYTLDIVRGGGFWYTTASGVLTFVPLSQITQITAQ